MYSIQIENDEGQTSEVSFSAKAITLGRAKSAQVCLPERNVSRQHARFTRTDEGVFVEDLDSYNGTFINGEKIDTKTPLYQGDRVKVGGYLIGVLGQLKPRSEEITKKSGQHSQLSEKTQTQTQIQPIIEPTMPATSLREIMQRERVSRNESYTDDDEATEIVNIPARKNPVVGELICIEGELKGRSFRLDKATLSLGQSKDQEVCLPHASVLPHHALLSRTPHGFLIQKAADAGVIIVNDKSTQEYELKMGDVLQIGKLKFVFSLVETFSVGYSLPEEQTRPSIPNTNTKPQTIVSKKPSKSRYRLSWLLLVLLIPIALVAGAFLSRFLFSHGNEETLPQEVHKMPEQPASVPIVNHATPSDKSLQIQESTHTHQETEQAIAALVSKVQVLMKARTWDQASALIQEGIKKYPNYTALSELQEEIDNEKGAQSTFLAAEKSQRKGDLKTALELYKQIAEQSRYHAQARQSIEHLLTIQKKEIKEGKDKNKNDKKEIKKKELTTDNPLNPPTHTDDNENSHKESIRQQAESHFNKGKDALKEGKLQDAIMLFRESVRTDPTFASPHRHLGIAFAKLGDGQSALEHYRMYLNLAPHAVDANQVKSIIRAYEDNPQ